MDTFPSTPLIPALEAKMAGFSRLLRGHGFAVGLGETQDALKVAEELLCVDFEAFQDGMRSLMCISERQFGPFDRLFRGYWAAPDPASRIDPDRRVVEARLGPSRGGTSLTTGIAEEPTEEGLEPTPGGASALEVLRRLDFSQVAAADQQRLQQAAARMWQRMALRRARRLRGHEGKARLHFRRTVRRNLALGGDPQRLVYAGRKPRKPKLVLLLDVSGSMELYSFLLLRMLHALHGRFRKAASFIFATELEEVTDCLRLRSLEQALAQIGRRRLGWSGGTRLGDCLHRLIALHGPRVLRPDAVFVILSDGLDVGAPERLADALREIKARTRRIVWLNPLLGIAGYQPLAGGMQAALPLVDVFAPAHSVESLLDIGRLLMK